MDRFWYWAMPAFGALLAIGVIYALVWLGIDNGTPPGWGIQAVITFLFFFPGLLLSIGLSQIILSRRRPREVFPSERVLIGIVVGLSLLLALSSIDEGGYVGIVIGPIIMIVAIALTITIAVNSGRVRAPVVVPAIWTQPVEGAKPDDDSPYSIEPAEPETGSPYGPNAER